MKNLNLYALANELNLGDPKSGTIRVPFGRWDFGEKKLADGRTVFFVQELTRDGAERMAAKINAGVADGEKGVPVYWGHPDVPELAHKYPDKRAKGWIKSAAVEADALVLSVEWLEENATDGFGWFSPYWGGPAKDLGQGRYLKQLDSLTSVALVNIPNIQEFRLANELQGGVNDNERTFQMPQHLIDLARRFDERASLANEANYDESKHPRAEDGKWTSGGGGGGKVDVGQAKEKLGLMLKCEAVSVAAGGKPGPGDIEFEHRGKRYYVGKDSEHMVKQFEDAGLVKRVSAGGGASPVKKSETERNAAKFQKSEFINWKERAQAVKGVNAQLKYLRDIHKLNAREMAGVFGKDFADISRNEKRGLHLAAIRAGLKYNRATHQYE